MLSFVRDYLVPGSGDYAQSTITADRAGLHQEARYDYEDLDTGPVIGRLHDKFIHVPIELLASRAKRMGPDGFAWSTALAATGQPERLE